MVQRTTAAERRERLRVDVAGAILLVAGGRFPEVQLANLPVSRADVARLRREAAAVGVDVIVANRPDGSGTYLRVSRR